MKITVEDLEAKGVSKYFVDWFRKNFGEEADDQAVIELLNEQLYDMVVQKL